MPRLGRSCQGHANCPLRPRQHHRPKLRDAAPGVARLRLRDYAASRGWQVFAEYVDTGWSGARASRPQLDRLLQDARARRFDAVLVWKLDRWGRSVADSIHSIQELVSLGIRFLAVTQNLDTDETNPMSRFLLHILAAFSELERERPLDAPGGPSGATRRYSCGPRARAGGKSPKCLICRCPR